MTPSHLYDLGPVMHADKGTDLRLTRQRRVVYEVIVSQRDHPTSQEVFARSKELMPSISLATVYNCLEALTQVGLVRQVNLDRSPTRYCPNLEDHAHFHCDACGAVSDVALPACVAFAVPAGAVVRRQEITLRGLCPDCASPPAEPHSPLPN
jgi:Fe2+ or Zn2+ uptake regulation protein